MDLARLVCSMEVYAIKVTLLETRPPVWRRILVDRDMTLRNFPPHFPDCYGVGKLAPAPVCSPEATWIGTKIVNESRARVGDVIGTAGERLLYEYDFGDGWQHELPLEEVLLGDESFRQMCLEGGTMLSARRLRRTPSIC
jgi:hypothetical protein